MKKSIKTAVCDLYDDIKLSQEELDGIRRRSNQTLDKKLRTKNIAIGSIVAIACTLVLSVSMWSFLPRLTLNTNKVEIIIRDVVNNHLLHKTLQYDTNSLLELSDKFSYLGFILSKPISIENDGELMGARPCFILDIPAAQLRYQTHNDLWTTVFQTRYQKNIYGPIPDVQDKQQPLVKIERGVRVSLWRENGLLFAVAQMDQRSLK